MKAENTQNHADAIISAVTGLVNEYFSRLGKPVSENSAAICIINDSGIISGKLFGTDNSDKIKLREKYDMVWNWVPCNSVMFTNKSTLLSQTHVRKLQTLKTAK